MVMADVNFLRQVGHVSARLSSRAQSRQNTRCLHGRRSTFLRFSVHIMHRCSSLVSSDAAVGVPSKVSMLKGLGGALGAEGADGVVVGVASG